MRWVHELAESGWVADPVVRWGIRRRLKQRLRKIGSEATAGDGIVEAMRQGPLAIETDTANEQHYELPPEFFRAVLGPRLKYSCCYWPAGVTALAEAEEASLEQTCSRAGVEDGMRVLDLGCGWGSLSLWIAERYPGCRVSAVSNSSRQGELMRTRAERLGLDNVSVLTADMNRFDSAERFDRIISIEMFEHIRNWPLLLQHIAGWLEPDGRLFVHHFCHRSRAYFFEAREEGDWMARHFFSGGLMPSESLLDEFAGPLELEQRWSLDGRHYEKTLLAWLANMDGQRPRIEAILVSAYGDEFRRWFQRWRMFFLACAESFGYGEGDEWLVSHSLWKRGTVLSRED